MSTEVRVPFSNANTLLVILGCVCFLEVTGLECLLDILPLNTELFDNCGVNFTSIHFIVTIFNAVVLVRIAIIASKYHDQKQCGEGEVYSCSHFYVTVHTESHESRNLCRGHEGCCLLACSSWLAHPGYRAQDD